MDRVRTSRLEAAGRARTTPILGTQYSRPKIAEDDYVDLFVDPANSRSTYFQFTVNADGTFKSADELRKLYCEDHGLTPDQPVITYCRIGERSAHSWFVLTYLLGFKRVRNYDGSWTEWGNLVGAPIERP